MIDLKKLRGKSTEFVGIIHYSAEPRTEVYCVRLNFNISRLVYYIQENKI